jgi:chromosome segregation ATPase
MAMLNQTIFQKKPEIMMLRNIAICLTIVGVMTACDMGKKEAAWKHQLDSLQAQISTQSDALRTLDEVGALIDSIDASRNLLRSNIVEGLPHDSYVARLEEINLYVGASKLKIDDLEKAVRKSKASNSNLTALVAKMKADLNQRGEEIALLTAELGHYRLVTDSLNTTVSMQNAELSDKLEQLTAKQEEVAKLEGQVKEILEKADYDMAESYYLRAQALELAAKRTNFAPRKKKTTKQEALELYRLAALSGKEEAAEKVRELEN